jgi:hypothetical protein
LNPLVMSNYSFFHKSIRLPLVILNLRAFSSKSSYFIFNSCHGTGHARLEHAKHGRAESSG